MSCKFDKTLLQDYLENTIEPLEKIFLEEHLKCCRECKKELNELKLLFFDLEFTSREDVKFPNELDGVREMALGMIDSKDNGFGPVEYLKTQKAVVNGSTTFLKYFAGNVKKIGKRAKK